MSDDDLPETRAWEWDGPLACAFALYERNIMVPPDIKLECLECEWEKFYPSLHHWDEFHRDAEEHEKTCTKRWWTVSYDDDLYRAAVRTLLRREWPQWKPEGCDVDSWGHGWRSGWHQGYRDAVDNPVDNPENDAQ